jgi:hypothetical protein
MDRRIYTKTEPNGTQQTGRAMAKGLSKITKPLALKLLSACDGDEIWSCQHCRSERVPEDWIARLRDVFESDFSEHGSTIFEEGKRVSQYEGVRSVDIAVAVAMSLGIQIDPWVLSQNHRAAIVAWIQERLEEQ